MPFSIVRNDITKMHTDAIVNAANSSLLGGGGVDGAIHKAAGSDLLKECRTLGGCDAGQAKATKGYALPCKYVIHTVGPVWQGGSCSERDILYSCYKNSLALAEELGCSSVAFPLISAGAYGYPRQEAIEVASSAISDFLEDHEMDIFLTLFGKDTVVIGEKLFGDIKQYIDDNYAELHDDSRSRRGLFANMRSAFGEAKAAAPMMSAMCEDQFANADGSLDDILIKEEETFSQHLLRLIDEKGLTDVQTYKKANIDRKLFSKIRSNKDYTPKKSTVLAFAIALELDVAQTQKLLEKAGYALSPSIKSDVIVKYFISHRNFDIFTINQALFSFDQSLIGV
ncbi:MAG: macro domain-containing protein [Ruminococcus sp.]|nr:macro domain-containing protein [Ruminococcus sp.]